MIRIAMVSCSSAAPQIAVFQDGFRAYGKEHGDWYLYSCPPAHVGSGETGRSLHNLEGWNGDGIVIQSSDLAELRAVKSLGLPVINLGGGLRSHCGVPRILIDNYAAGRLAAEHFLDRGIFNLAFFGWEQAWYSIERCHGFEDCAAEHGVSCNLLLRKPFEESCLSWGENLDDLTRWLTSLPRPCGVFAVQDYRSQLLVEACHDAGLKIPEEIAILGMDDDEIICEHSEPTLSSISRNSFKLGYEAASMLDLMIQGKPIPHTEILIPPADVITRASSDVMFSQDPDVRAAIEYMRTHLIENCSNSDIADHLGVSVRTLETRFLTVTKATVRECLNKIRISRAQRLLMQDPSRSPDSLIAECGFGSVSNFRAAFKRITGTPLPSYRDHLLSR